MKLSDFYGSERLIRDGVFSVLGYVDSMEKGTLVYCDMFSYFSTAIENECVSCIITTKELADEIKTSKGVLISPNPRTDFYVVHNKLVQDGLAVMHIEAGIGTHCSIHPTAIISKQSRIGNNVVIKENVVIKDNVIIGDNTFIDAGVVVGCEGLLYIIGEPNIFVKHAGGVKIGSHVTILSNAVIARSIHNTIFTEIGDHSIIGVSSTVGHEARLGTNCVVSGNCVIARRASLQNGVRIESSSVVREHVVIGKGSQVKAGSIVVKNVPENSAVSGNFAMEHNKHMKLYLRNSK